MPTTIQRGPLAWAKEVARKAIRPSGKEGLAYPEVAEAKDVKFLTVAERQTEAGRVLFMEGLVFHSALAVAGITHSRQGDALVVEVRLTPARADMSGRFSTELAMEAGIRKVLFGRDLALIWSDAHSP